MIRKLLSIACFGLLVGSISSLASIGFVQAIIWMNANFLSESMNRIGELNHGYLYLMSIFVPATGGLIVGLLCRSIRERRPLNISDTILSAQILKPDAPMKNGLKTAIAGIIGMGSGASVGQYGPVAHLGASIGVWISGFTRRTGFTGTMGIGCGAAAAIATVFNAPIAGLIFAHEVILRHYSLKAFAPVTVSSVTGYIFANYIFELEPLFRIDYLTPIQAPEFLVFIVIGVFGALLAVLFVRLVFVMGSIAERIAIAEYLKPALAGMVVGVVSIWIPEILGVGQSVLRNAILPSYTDWELAYILVAKVVLTAMCLGFGFAGGIFSPALLVGVLFGSLVGGLMPDIMIEHFSSVAVYAICGMVAVTSPIIGAPLTVIIIVLELTRNYELTIAAMVSVVFANLVGYRLMGRSIFDIQLERRGFDLSLGRDRAMLENMKITDIVSEEYVSATPDTSAGLLLEKLLDADKSEAYILGHGDKYLGTVTALQLAAINNKSGLLNSPCSAHLQRESIVLGADTTIWSAMEQIREFKGESIPVVASDGHEILLGVVYESTVIKAYMDTLYNIRQEEYGAN